MPDIAVLLPQDSQFDAVFDAVNNLCSQLGFTANKIQLSEEFSEKESLELKQSILVVVDLSVENFYTALAVGMAMAGNKVLVAISQSENTPGYKMLGTGGVVLYSLGEEGLSKLQKDLYGALKTHKDSIKEDVQNLLKKQEITYGALEKTGKNDFGYEEYKLIEESLHFILIPGGPFVYGKTDKKEEASSFLMSKYLLTNEQWNHFLEATKYNWGGHWLGRPEGKLQRVKEYPSEMAEYPIVDISLHDLVQYTDWLNEEYGDKEIHFSIPDEKQWEKASRGPEGNRFPWGNDVPNHELALYEQDLRHGTAPVDSFQKGASPYGCLHMSGNVLEWTKSFYTFDYTSRIVRGGSYAIEPLELECITKITRKPDIRHWTGGARIVVLVW